MEKSLDLSLMKIECDFNSMGIGGDDCIYDFYRRELHKLRVGARCILYSFDSETEITACEAAIESFIHGWKGMPGDSFFFCGYRARPFENTWYWGIIPWEKTNDEGKHA